MKNSKSDAPEGKKFYGSVTVSERGQIVIPAEARKDFEIKGGDKLLVLGDLQQGIAIVTLDSIQKMMSSSAYFVQMMQKEFGGGKESSGK
jgi:AbrB family looped-hinge helix DNA binding protein